MTDAELLAELEDVPEPYELAPMATVVDRFLACAECPKAKAGKCTVTGVFVIIAGKRADSVCPDKRW